MVGDLFMRIVVTAFVDEDLNLLWGVRHFSADAMSGDSVHNP